LRLAEINSMFPARSIETDHKSTREWHYFEKKQTGSTKTCDVFNSLLAHRYHNVSQRPQQRYWSCLLKRSLAAFGLLLVHTEVCFALALSELTFST